MKTLFAALLMLVSISAQAVPVNDSVHVSTAVPYCLSTTPYQVGGYFIPIGVTPMVSVASGVGSVLTITQSDGVNSYVSKVDTSVAGTTSATACAVRQ